MRPGSRAARRLFKIDDPEAWRRALGAYDAALQSVANKRKKPGLAVIDRWLTGAFAATFEWSDAPSPTEAKFDVADDLDAAGANAKVALEHVFHFKIWRGKFRPLRGYVTGNRAPSIGSRGFILTKLKVLTVQRSRP